MKKCNENSKLILMFIFVWGTSFLSGCMTSHRFTISQKDINEGCYAEGPQYKQHMCNGIRAWKDGDYRRSGDLLKAAYIQGKANGGSFSTESIIQVLGTATKAYHLAGAIEQERYTAKLLYRDLGTESYYLPLDLKVLIYLATLDSENPAFADEVPSSLRLANHIIN